MQHLLTHHHCLCASCLAGGSLYQSFVLLQDVIDAKFLKQYWGSKKVLSENNHTQLANIIAVSTWQTILRLNWNIYQMWIFYCLFSCVFWKYTENVFNKANWNSTLPKCMLGCAGHRVLLIMIDICTPGFLLFTFRVLLSATHQLYSFLKAYSVNGTALTILTQTLMDDKVCWPIDTHTNPWGRLKWLSTIIRLTAYFTCGLVPDLGLCRHTKECGYTWPWMSILRLGFIEQHTTCALLTVCFVGRALWGATHWPTPCVNNCWDMKPRRWMCCGCKYMRVGRHIIVGLFSHYYQDVTYW